MMTVGELREYPSDLPVHIGYSIELSFDSFLSRNVVVIEGE